MRRIQSLTGIERARPSDLKEIKKLLESCDLTLAGVNDAEFWLVRDAERKVKACVGLETHGKNGLLRSLAVKKGHRNSGIGGSLVHHIIDVAKERNLENLFLLTLDARDYFPKFRFVPTTRASVAQQEISKSSEFEACSTASTLMRLRISPRSEK